MQYKATLILTATPEDQVGGNCTVNIRAEFEPKFVPGIGAPAQELIYRLIAEAAKLVNEIIERDNDDQLAAAIPANHQPL